MTRLLTNTAVSRPVAGLKEAGVEAGLSGPGDKAWHLMDSQAAAAQCEIAEDKMFSIPCLLP